MNPMLIDVDGHILEPADLWVRNLEPRFKDRGVRLERDEQGLEYWSIAGRKHPFYDQGTTANVATIGKTPAWRKEHIFDKHDIGWEEGLAMNPAASDPDARVRMMDEEGIDISILYPTLGLSLGQVREADLAAAYCRVYNDWIIDFCRRHPRRLVPALVMPWTSMDEAVKELRRTAGIGLRALQLPSSPPRDITYGRREWDPVWAECEAQGLPVGLHVGSAGTSASSLHYPELALPGWWGFVVGAIDTVLSFMSFFQGAVFDRFPGLRLVVLESGSAWMPWVLGRMDEKYEVLGFTTSLARRPSEYFRERCWISMDPDDGLAPETIRHLGADRVVWAYDYPHSDSPLEPVANLKRTLGALSREEQAKVMGENAMALYGLA